jgi:hypothetical protein
MYIGDAEILGLEAARSQLARLDGKHVKFVFRPISGIGRYSLPLAPQLPDSPWDDTIQACIALEDRLNQRLAAQYTELAASTLADLTPDEIELVTQRPALDENAHLIGDHT